MIEKNYKHCTQYCPAVGIFTFLHVVFGFVSCVLFLVLRCLFGNSCSFTVCIVVVYLCVLLSYV